MKLFDLHQDLLTHLRFGKQFGQSTQTSFESIKASSIDLVVATAFPCPPTDDQYHDSVPSLITEELELYQEFLKANPDWKLVETASDLLSDKQKIVLHLEGLNVFDGSVAAWKQLEQWRGLGVRSIGTHWNVNNKLGGGTLQPTVGITALGREVIHYLEQNNLVFDLAHMSRQGFMEAAAITTRPLYVSHGNVDALCSNARNYTDDQLRLIAETNGVIGVFFANTFVVGRGTVGTIDNVLDHISYIRDFIGIEHIAIGTDLGGIISGGIVGLEHVDQLGNLEDTLLAADYTEDEIEAILYKNALRVLRTHLG
jgi:membrane dipeptidase